MDGKAGVDSKLQDPNSTRSRSNESGSGSGSGVRSGNRGVGDLGGGGDDSELDQSNLGKQAWIEKAMQDRRSEWTEAKKLTVFCGTWNVNAKKPTENITTWIKPSTKQTPTTDQTSSIGNEELPDIYCLGFQEVVDLNAQSLLVDHNVSKDWQGHIENTLIKTKARQIRMGEEYVLKKSVHLVGLLMLIYVKRDLVSQIKRVDAEVCGVGILGYGGNKGAVAVRMDVYDTSICFINSHLAAHKNNVQGRNSDFLNICKRLRFKGLRHDEKIGDHNYSFWIGDLNYRLTCTDLNEVYREVEESNIAKLLRSDQLLLEKASQRTFQGWHEGDITFLPTYKYETGTDRYDRREDKKKRFPAWCDRIQWKIDQKVKGTKVKMLYYKRAEQKSSDHKPVMAWFDVTAQNVIKLAKARVLQSITRQFDAWENNQIPQVSLARNHLNFADVRFEMPQRQVVVVENIGKSVAEYYFASGAGSGSQPSKEWLSVEPFAGYIPPGHKIELQITVHVGSKSAGPLNQGLDSLQSMLIFRLKCGRQDDLGKDYYITINGSYLRSAFGCSLEYLVRSPMPVRSVGPSTKVHPEAVLTLPKEVWRIADYIYQHGMQEEDLFLTSGDQKQIAEIRECLDTGADFGKFAVHSMAEAFIEFLVSLSQPIFRMELIDEMRSDANLTDFCKQALLRLTPIHYNAFIYILSFLREVLKYSSSNKLTADKIVPLFTKCLFHYNPGAAEKLQNMRQKPYLVLNHYLTNDDFVVH
mmetsp:Transcript_29682/g.52112  ORF Transcript_29682/g.52112 Transcript_29682/m.52112 type:complete len:752 (-) Transcript_29682:209-2464(-)|eukprot:CAMPEP_0197535040 /NCGR_PEP_ID=MMETSP1318-20131121/49247_1 /TAXON_ID=552666 /ORGANISM="Partenskyella glossopodia, Strain RCC365" /LENGTH=751 /DNA_ID=CAMNT_0043092515 /DNA_START=284 /DNA_END=2539 /DNA_ORIENTATION=+